MPVRIGNWPPVAARVCAKMDYVHATLAARPVSWVRIRVMRAAFDDLGLLVRGGGVDRLLIVTSLLLLHQLLCDPTGPELILKPLTVFVVSE